jgi:glycosyltransferase involved in cell wall biosynthesis
MISILMPIYNGIEFIHESISSIQNQTYPTWELIVAINGHPLNSSVYQIAKQYESDKIKVVQFSEKGKSNTLNEMIKYCQYDYVALLDVDDIWHPYKLAYQMPFIQDYDVVGTQCVYFGDLTNSPSIPFYDISNFNMKYNPMINSSVIIKKELCHWNSDEDGIEDYGLWIRLRKQNKRFYNCPDILVKHRIHRTSAFNSQHQDVEQLKLRYGIK